MSKETDKIIQDIRAWGLTFPGAHLKSPWPGHLDLAVKDKTFAYLSLDGEPIGVGVKLPMSNEKALMMPNAKPMEYGLGKSGWVSIQFAPDEVPPVDLVRDWIVESYRAQAPKTLVKQFEAQLAGGGAPATTSAQASLAAKAPSMKAAPAKAAVKAPTAKAAVKAPAAKATTQAATKATARAATKATTKAAQKPAPKKAAKKPAKKAAKKAAKAVKRSANKKGKARR